MRPVAVGGGGGEGAVCWPGAMAAQRAPASPPPPQPTPACMPCPRFAQRATGGDWKIWCQKVARATLSSEVHHRQRLVGGDWWEAPGMTWARPAGGLNHCPQDREASHIGEEPSQAEQGHWQYRVGATSPSCPWTVGWRGRTAFLRSV